MSLSASDSSFSKLSNVDCVTTMAGSDCAATRDHNASRAIKPRDERGNVFSGNSECECFVCVSVAPCSFYVTDPSPLRGRRRCPPGPFKVISAQRGGLRKREREDLGISLVLLPLYVSMMLFPVCLARSLSLCFLSVSFLSLPFIMTVTLCMAPEKVLRVHDVMK